MKHTQELNNNESRINKNAWKNSISLEQAQELIFNRINPLSPVSLALDEALRCTVAEDIFAEIENPPFPRSPLDGYALCAADSMQASKKQPVTLKVVGASYAGTPSHVSLHRGQAVLIMTGGCIPNGADCVIRQEDTDEGEETVCIYTPLASYENYCCKGEDFQRGELLIKKGTPVTAAVTAVAASAGYTILPCTPTVQAAVISTGDELQPLGQPLVSGHIYNSNGVFLQNRLRELHAQVPFDVTAVDQIDILASTIMDALHHADILITTGGVSVGRRDLVPDALRELGAEIIFHGVAIKPGMPALFAMMHGKPILALSGNPFAAAASFELLVRPALASLSLNTALYPQVVTGKLENGFNKKSPSRRFLRGRFEDGIISLSGTQGNGQFRSMIGCNCLVEIPAGSGSLNAGEQVIAHLI